VVVSQRDSHSFLIGCCLHFLTYEVNFVTVNVFVISPSMVITGFSMWAQTMICRGRQTSSLAYSYLSVSNGSTLVARRAGK
jgi:hypothetical protein